MNQMYEDIKMEEIINTFKRTNKMCCIAVIQLSVYIYMQKQNQQ